MTPAQALSRASDAKLVIDNPMYQDAYNLTRLAIIERIEKCPMVDTEQAEKLRMCLKLLGDVRANLEATLNSGKIVQFNIAEAERKKKFPLTGFFR